MSENKAKGVFAIIEKEGREKAYWLRIGTAFTNRDDSVTVLLDALPVGHTKLQIRELRDWKQDENANEREAA